MIEMLDTHSHPFTNEKLEDLAEQFTQEQQ
jgi:hypothetical protein